MTLYRPGSKYGVFPIYKKIGIPPTNKGVSILTIRNPIHYCGMTIPHIQCFEHDLLKMLFLCFPMGNPLLGESIEKMVQIFWRDPRSQIHHKGFTLEGVYGKNGASIDSINNLMGVYCCMIYDCSVDLQLDQQIKVKHGPYVLILFPVGKTIPPAPTVCCLECTETIKRFGPGPLELVCSRLKLGSSTWAVKKSRVGWWSKRFTLHFISLYII